jgi:hypothetical protein
MRAVRTSKLSPYAAAIHYKVPERTLRAHLAENKQTKSKLGRKIVFSPQQEKELSKRINRLAQTGYPITLKIKRICVFTYCEKNNIPNPFVREKGMAGRACLEGFFCRNLMTAARKAQYLNPGRAQQLTRFIVNDYFAKLKITMEELGIMNKTECIYNVDEKGCSVCLHKQHHLYTWLKEMLTGNVTSIPWPYYPHGCR